MIVLELALTDMAVIESRLGSILHIFRRTRTSCSVYSYSLSLPRVMAEVNIWEGSSGFVEKKIRLKKADGKGLRADGVRPRR